MNLNFESFTEQLQPPIEQNLVRPACRIIEKEFENAILAMIENRVVDYSFRDFQDETGVVKRLGIDIHEKNGSKRTLVLDHSSEAKKLSVLLKIYSKPKWIFLLLFILWR